MWEEHELPDADYASIYGYAALHARIVARMDAHLTNMDIHLQHMDVTIARLRALERRALHREGLAPELPA